MIQKILFLITGLALILLCSACNWKILKGYNPDNVLEEFAEKEIEHYTGLELDFSPHASGK